MALAGEYGLVYTRYADDLTFSGDYLPKDEVLVRIHRIIREEGFTMNVKKTASCLNINVRLLREYRLAQARR